MLQSLYKAFDETDASLAEINPLILTGDGKVIALDVASGKVLWKVSVSSEVLAAPLVTGDRVIVRSVDGLVLVVEPADGIEAEPRTAA